MNSISGRNLVGIIVENRYNVYVVGFKKIFELRSGRRGRTFKSCHPDCTFVHCKIVVQFCRIIVHKQDTKLAINFIL